ncbi:hypothetical protein TGAMA5MH_05790 [Trichoderma gamsii]|uniref:Phosphatidylethanolamine N-methyltransferase n=1 Tax=Trichoderma gamsii TaxID=398673 RepID=A0A2K0T9A8_9HYPO|nr:hypothetical protein TGAMA5MH_05790 [Trichoderma gamsii]
MASSFSIADLVDYVDLDKKSLLISACSIIFNPLFWNIVARKGSK